MMEEDGNILVIGFSVEVVECLILLMIFDIGLDDEDCDGEFSLVENGFDDVID